MKNDIDLIPGIDLCQIPECIRDRFAQLTLSSKKRQHHLNKEIKAVAQQELSRSHLQELLTDDESETEAEELNKLFHSRTSAGSSEDQKGISDHASFLERLQVTISDKDVNSFKEIGLDSVQENSVTKDFILNPSESLFTHQDPSSHSLNLLSAQISSLVLTSPTKVEEATEKLCLDIGNISVFDRNTHDNIAIAKTLSDDSFPQSVLVQNKDIALAETVSGNISEIISTESHRSSIPRKTSFDYIHLKKEIDCSHHDTSILTISSTSSTPHKNSSFSISETDEEDIIVLSDSESEKSRSLNVSSMRPSGQTNLGSTLSNTAADRIEAFLKDIPSISSDQKQNYSEKLVQNDSIANSTCEDSLLEDSIEIKETSSEEEINDDPPHESEVKLQENIEIGKKRNEPEQSSKPLTPVVSSNISNCIEKINISATIKIKVQITEPCLTDVDSSSSVSEDMNGKSQSESLHDRNSVTETEDPETQNNEYTKHKSIIEKELQPSNSSVSRRNSPTKYTTPIKNAVDNIQNQAEPCIELNEKAKNLLDQLYGSAWKTPEIIKSLDKKEKTEESGLNFTDFHENINNAFESTRVNLREEGSPQPSSKETINFKKPLDNNEVSCIKKQIRDGAQYIAPVTKTTSGRKDTQRKKFVDPISSDEEPMPTSDNSWINTSSSSITDEEFRITRKNKKKHIKNDDKLIFVDLSANEIKVQDSFESPAANNDKNFNERLQNILKTCKYEDKPKIETTPASTKTKRKLFTPQFGDESEDQVPPTPLVPIENLSLIDDSTYVKLRTPLPAIFAPINKQLEAVKTGTPIFNIKKQQSSTKKKDPSNEQPISNSSLPQDSPRMPSRKTPAAAFKKNDTPFNKYGFLKSLDVTVSKGLCHPDALYYRENFKSRKAELVQRLFGIYNEKLFNNELDIPIVWNKKLLNTAGRCSNKKKLSGERSSKIELSEKVLTSADRLRCTLIHELCHAATWIYSGENGHGATWKAWARKANEVFPELPNIGICHQYDIEYKYTYKCTLCGAKSHAHSKSKKVENIRCSFCHGAIEIFLNKKNKEGKIVPTPVKGPSGFAKFVKEKYKVYKTPDRKHADVMKLLSNEYSSLSISEKNKY